MSEPQATVACAICGIARRRLYSHIKSAHGMSKEEYQAEYPGSPLVVPGSMARSAECRRKQSEAAKRRWSSEGEREEQSKRLKKSASWKGRKLSASHRAAISRGGKGVKHDISDERREELAEQGRRVLEEIRQRPDHSEKLSAAAKRRHARDPLVGLKNPETRRKSLESRIRNGTLIPPNSGRGICGFREGIPHYCRSTFEANFARILLKEGIRYEYEPRVFKLDSGRYCPDFYLHDTFRGLSGWVELKGWRKKDGSLPGKTPQKIRDLEEQEGETVSVLVQNSPEWRDIRSSYSDLMLEAPRKNLRTHPELFGVEV